MYLSLKIINSHHMVGSDLSQKSPEPNMWLLVNYTKPTNILYCNWYLLRADNYKSAARNYKVTPLTVQYLLQSIVWLTK